MNQTNAVLTHVIGKESKIVVRKSSEVMQSDFFFSQYRHAIKVAEKIVENADASSKETTQFENVNNIIAFIGDRGSGKTSCMLTFANILVEGNDDVKFENKNLKADFYQLPAIDPSFFSEDYNIIGAFIATIYREFQKFTKDNHNYNSLNQGKTQDFYKSLADAQRSFGRLSAPDKDKNDDMERLEQLSCSMKLKEDIKKLTKCFFDCVSEEKTHLLIAIDDIDLNTKTAVEMIEWIRKYLIQPNIVILFAVKIDQLFDLKLLSLVEEYKSLLQYQKMPMSELNAMSERYMTKLFPLANRVYMPNMTNLPFAYYQSVRAQGDNEEKSNKIALREAIVEEINNKTGYSFFNTYFTTNLVVPANLRESLHLMRLLNDMKKPGNDEGLLAWNRRTFQEFLLHDYLYKKLNTDSIELINELECIIDASQFNSAIIRILKQKFLSVAFSTLYEKETSLTEVQKETQYIFNESNYSYNISMGDVMGVMSLIEGVNLNLEERYFLFVIKTIYSIRLLESSEHISNDVQESPEYVGHYTYTKFEQSKISDFHQMLAGQIFNPYLVSFIQNNCATISDRKVNLAEFFNKLNFDNEDDCQIAEFVMLCINGPINRILKEDRHFRENNTVRYSAQLTKGSTYSIFDYYSLWYNITDVASCYYRFLPMLEKKNWKKIVDNTNALWRKLLPNAGTLYEANGEDIKTIHSYLLYGAICNTEIYEDFSIFCMDRKRISEGSDVVEKMKGFARIFDMYNQPRHNFKGSDTKKLLDISLENIIKDLADKADFKYVLELLEINDFPSIDEICNALFKNKQENIDEFGKKLDFNKEKWNDKINKLIYTAASQSKKKKIIKKDDFVLELSRLDVDHILEGLTSADSSLSSETPSTTGHI